ncbi:hypothetical protein NDU88_006752 [Pleurodeles waltl]|uniref:Glutathione peroxidase n=1 Tax=Pleurodeles waltl TaxID=8319 RepID=A0AAV7PPD7_PLEWA|nr:hypothetical protein NDU88_006752 [Pleurodeles waltl]
MMAVGSARALCILPVLLSALAQAQPDQQQVDCYNSVDGTAHNYGLTLQYLELNALHEELGPYGLVILGFPCNQFGMQEPGSNDEILLGLKHVRPGGGFVPKFQLFEKGDVNGKKEQKLFTFLKNSCPPVGLSFGNPTNRLFWENIKVNDIKWNFEKFLVDPEGKPVRRWHPRTNVSVVKRDIIEVMRAARSPQKKLFIQTEQK